MRILRVRRGFQADHSSSSYLFYAVDHPVSAEGRAVAHRYSSRAEVHDRTVRYHKWGESSLDSHAYEALLGAHYDVMVSESYDWWTLMLALPKTPQMQALLAPFTEARGYDDQGVEIEDYGKRLVVVIYCAFEGNGVGFAGDDNENALETLVDLLVKIRAELKGGDTSFLEAVVSFYGGDESDEDDDERPTIPPTAALETLSKDELQQECKARGVAFRKSWTKAQLCDALVATAPTPSGARLKGRKSRLSQAAQKIVSQLDRA
ncbi:MAG: hypothetical protein JO114_04320 [Planctomycetaceae bacterium]|nr:hypothetical protein [Planctomycetaceae bacterium]